MKNERKLKISLSFLGHRGPAGVFEQKPTLMLP